MIINVKVDERNRLTSFATFGTIEGGVDIEVDESFDSLVDFAYELIGNKLVFNQSILDEYLIKVSLVELRLRREEECFTVINRGGLWYDLLTRSEKDELLEWYQAWLDVTITGVIPNMPDWLK